ncbi:MAG: ribonuclease HI family protein [Candidatus Babeliales bacterium]|nr:ribonuclease HI family protein [Candidatus Babeliales bacterium]
MTSTQLNIFEANSKPKLQPIDTFQLSLDGASRNNPGPAGAGICIKKNTQLIMATGAYLGHKTNNQAEYLALLLGLFFVKQFLKSDDVLHIKSDSELLVKQILGHYKIKNPELQKLHGLGLKFLKNIKYKIEHVLREKNKEADEQANLAVDKKIKLPKEFVEILNEHNIII